MYLKIFETMQLKYEIHYCNIKLWNKKINAKNNIWFALCRKIDNMKKIVLKT